MSYVNNMSYVSRMIYVINMRCLKLYKLRHMISKFYECFYGSLEIK